MADNSADQFVISEDGVPDPITIILTDTDMPFGFPRDLAAFESGGKIEIAEDGIYNPGSDRVVLQVMQPKERPLVIKGRFRDRIYTRAQTGESSDHARFMRNQFERMRYRGNPVTIKWGADTRTGLLWETKFGEEGQHDISYELTFFIAVSPLGTARNNQEFVSAPAPSLDDLRLQMETALENKRAAMLAMLIQTVASAALSNLLGGIQSTLNVLGNAASILERANFATTQALFSHVNRINTAAQLVQDNVALTKAVLDSMRADTTLVVVSADNSAAWWSAMFDMELLLDQIIDAMRQIRLQAQQQIKQTTRLYRVRQDDTLESIARSQLGSAARVTDLGISAYQLVPGKYVRIPNN